MKVVFRAFFVLFLALFLLVSNHDNTNSPSTERTSYNATEIAAVSTLSEPEKASITTLSERTEHYEHAAPARANNASSASPTRATNQNHTPTHAAAQNQVQSDSISIRGASSSLVYANASNGTLPDMGSKIGYNGKFYYGHVTTSVFRNLPSLNIGDTFTITRNGVTETYKVSVKETISKPKCTNDDTSECATFNKIRRANYKGSYDIALMTCAGTLYGNGDSSHRLIIMASRV